MWKLFILIAIRWVIDNLIQVMTYRLTWAEG